MRLDSGVSKEQFTQGLAEAVAKCCMQSGALDDDDSSSQGGELLKIVLRGMVQEKDFKKRVKNIFPGYNEELFLDGFN